MIDLVDQFELAHGIYPVAFDRRWHCGVHLMPSTQNEKVRAIADGDVVAYRVSQKAYDGGGGVRDSNAGFVLLKHTTETGEGRTLTFYSLYMHLLDLDSYNGADGNQLPEFLRLPTPGGDTEPSSTQSGGNLKVQRKDVLGWVGACHTQRQLHCEIFMTQADFAAYFGHRQLGNSSPSMSAASDCWGHNYFVIPAGSSFRAQPLGIYEQSRLKGMRNAGFRDVVPLTGGLDAWWLAGFRVANLTEFGEIMATSPEEAEQMAQTCAMPLNPAAAGPESMHKGFSHPHRDRA